MVSIISIVLPNWPYRFQSNSFQKFISNTFIKEAPANIFVNVKWLGYEELIQLEDSYYGFIDCKPSKIKLKEQKLTDFLTILMNNG